MTICKQVNAQYQLNRGKSMIKLIRTIICIGVFSLGLLSTANANLVARPGGMVYDTDLNITWLSDANYAKTSGYDADGAMNWSDANTWAAGLNVGGVSGWRLPTVDPTCSGFCTTSEMGHLFYIELGGTARHSIFESSDPDLALFTHIQSYYYWFGTEYSPDPDFAWDFDPSYGHEAPGGKEFDLFAWAVHDGDVGLIPEPEMYAMMFIGLLAMFSFVRLRQQS